MSSENRNDPKNQEDKNRTKNPGSTASGRPFDESKNRESRDPRKGSIENDRYKSIDPNMDPKNRPQMRSEQDQKNTNKNPANRESENNNPNNPKKRY